MTLGIAMFPAALRENYLTILVIALPSIAFIYLIITRPHILLVDNKYFKTKGRYYSIDHKYNAQKRTQQEEVDRILDKISKKGLKSLTPKEKALLENHSKSVK